MTKSPLSLAEIRQMLQPKSERQTLSYSAVDGGIPKGAVTAISGHGKTEFVLKFLREHPELNCAWIEDHFSAFPFAFFQENVPSQQVLFIESATGESRASRAKKDNTVWACLQILRSSAFPILVFYSELTHLNADQKRKTLRKLQLAAEKSDTTVLWLAPPTETQSTAWAVSSVLLVDRIADDIQVHQLKRKF